MTEIEVRSAGLAEHEGLGISTPLEHMYSQELALRVPTPGFPAECERLSWKENRGLVMHDGVASEQAAWKERTTSRSRNLLLAS
jgi:hypothetical protein